MTANPFTDGPPELAAFPTEDEIAAFRRQNPELAQKLWPIRYEGGVDADGLGVGL